MSVLRRRASPGSVTRICCRMISAEVMGRLALGDPAGARTARPGEPGAEEAFKLPLRRAVEGCVALRALSPSARLTRLLTTFIPVPPLGPAPILGEASPPSAPSHAAP